MHESIYDTHSIFRAFMTGKGKPVEDHRCRVRTLSFESEYADFLLPEDRLVEENTRFSYLMIEPVMPSRDGFDEVLALMHGLNEGSPAKLFPWAYNLAARLQMPVLIFPMAFHMGRRSAAWGFTPQVRVSNERSGISGNRKSSPFNALISERIAAAPERFTRGGLQSYYDLIHLHDRIHAGEHPGCRPGARMNFLGYSAGGYLSLILMLADPEGKFSDSRCVVFASGAAMEDMDPESLFILDTDASHRLMEFLQSRGHERMIFDATMASLVTEPAFWFSELFFHGETLTTRLETLRPRLLALAGEEDRVITGDGMSRNLKPLEVGRFPLGVHEFPFTIPDPLTDTYDRRTAATREIISGIKNSQHIGAAYRDVFAHFLDETASFLRPDGLLREN